MRRKVVQQGPSTLMVSLPSSWAKSAGVKKGDELSVYVGDRELRISLDTESSVSKSVELDISGLDRASLFYLLRSLYMLCYDEIFLKFDSTVVPDFNKDVDEDIRDLLRLEVSRMQGLEIFSLSKDSCVLKSISAELGDEFKNMYRRVLLLFRDTVESFMRAYADDDEAGLRAIEDYHTLISKFVYYCDRIMHKGGSRFDSSYSRMLMNVDMAADDIKYCARISLKGKRKPSKAVISVLEGLVDIASKFIDLDRKFSFPSAKDAIAARIALQRVIVKHLSTDEPQDILAYLFTCLECVRFMFFNRFKLYCSELE